MRKLLNTLYITRPLAYLALEGENILVREDGITLARYPLHNLEGVVSFSEPGLSPALIGKCIDEGIAVSFVAPSGRFRGSIIGEPTGNVLLRKKQLAISENETEALKIARLCIFAKLYNQRWIVERYKRQYELRIDCDKLTRISVDLSCHAKNAFQATNMESLRGIEGNAQSVYFSVFDDMILQSKKDFFFKVRSRRPPLDRVNALLSFAYVLLMHEVKAALTTVGLDPYVGFMHTDRPGRPSLALDMMEELRGVMADRFVLTLINREQIQANDFLVAGSGATELTDEARKRFIQLWQERKQQILEHPFLKEKTPWGLIPYVQALLLARYIRGDLDAYPCFLWK